MAITIGDLLRGGAEPASYGGEWDASTGSYPATPRPGFFYQVTVAGTVATIDYVVGDTILWDGSQWLTLAENELILPWDASTGSYPSAPVDDQMYIVTVAGTVSATYYQVGQIIFYDKANTTFRSLGTDLSIEEEGVEVDGKVSIIDFVGPGITATQTAPGEVQVSVAGNALAVEEEGVSVDADTTTIDFVGDTVTATQTAPGEVQVAVTNPPTLTVEEEGVSVDAAVSVMDFVGGNITATQTTPGEVQITLDPSGITQWNADPVGSLPAQSSALGGTYDSGTQTLTVSASPAGNNLISGGSGLAANTLSGAVALLDYNDVIDSNFNAHALIKPQFDSATGTGSDGAIAFFGFVPTTASAQDVFDIFAAVFAASPGDIPANCPWFWISNFLEGALVGGAELINTQFWDGTNQYNISDGGTGYVSVTDLKVPTSFGYGVDTNTDTVIQSAATMVDGVTEEDQIAGSLLESAVTLNGVACRAVVGALSVDLGSGHNVANQTAVFAFDDGTYNPHQLLAGSNAAIALTKPSGGNYTQTDYDNVFGNPAILLGGGSAPALPAADIIQANLTAGSYSAYGATIYNDAIYGSNQTDTLWPLTNEDAAALIATNAADIATNAADIAALSTVDAGVNASTTGGQGSTPLTAVINMITSAVGAGADVTLPSATAGSRIIVHNQNAGLHDIDVFVASGDYLNDTSGAILNGSLTLKYGEGVEFAAVNATDWTVHGLTDLTTLGTNDIANDSGVAGATATAAIDQLNTDIGALTSDDISNASTVTGAAVSDALETLDTDIGNVVQHVTDYITNASGLAWTDSTAGTIFLVYEYTGTEASLLDLTQFASMPVGAEFVFINSGSSGFNLYLSETTAAGDFLVGSVSVGAIVRVTKKAAATYELIGSTGSTGILNNSTVAGTTVTDAFNSLDSSDISNVSLDVSGFSVTEALDNTWERAMNTEVVVTYDSGASGKDAEGIFNSIGLAQGAISTAISTNNTANIARLLIINDETAFSPAVTGNQFTTYEGVFNQTLDRYPIITDTSANIGASCTSLRFKNIDWRVTQASAVRTMNTGFSYHFIFSGVTNLVMNTGIWWVPHTANNNDVVIDMYDDASMGGGTGYMFGTNAANTIVINMYDRSTLSSNITDGVTDSVTTVNVYSREVTIDPSAFGGSGVTINYIYDLFTVESGITASTTQTQGQQPLTREINEVATVATTNDVVTLPSATVGKIATIINNGANTLQIFPASGDNLGAGVDTATTLVAGGKVTYKAYDATNWEEEIDPAVHIASTGADHSYIDQDVTTTSSPSFVDVTTTGFFNASATTGITASTTQSQGQQALTTSINEVSTVGTTNDVVTMPAAAAGKEVTIQNNGANTLQIFPASGDDVGAGVDTSITLAAGSAALFKAQDATTWIQVV